MATLFNTKISATYEGLLKTIDNAAISATLRELTDGSGNQSGLFLNTSGDFKVTSVLEWGSLKDTGTGVTITQFVTAANGIENFNNDTTLPTSAAVKLYVDTKFATSDTLQEVLSFGNTTSGKDIAVSAGDDITFTDSSKILMGTSSDLQIYHDGSNSYIKDTGTGDLYLEASTSFFVRNADNGEVWIKGTDAGVSLRFQDAQKLITTNTGVDITGRLSGLTDPTLAQDAATKYYVDGLDAGSDLDITDGTNTGEVNLNTQTLSILGTTNEIDAVVSGQGVTIGLPTSISTNLVGNVTGNLTGNVTGDLTGNVTSTSVLANGVTATTQASNDDSTKVATTAYVKGLDNASDLDFSGDSGSGDVNLNTQTLAVTGTTNQIESIASNQGLNLKFPNAGVTLPNGSLATTQSAGDNSTKISTTQYVDSSAALYLPLAGGTMSGNTIHNDNVKSTYGTGSDAQVYHDGSNFYANNTTGQLNIDQSAVTQSIVFKVSNANALDTTALIINREGDLITGKDVTIAGDLTVNGTTTTVNSQTLSVDDPLISLAINNAANSLDIGYYGKYNDGTTRYLGLFNDASDSNKFKLFRGTTVEPTTTVNIGGAGYLAADLVVAGLEASLVTSSGDVIADTHFNSSDTNATLSTTGAGNVFLRPNGKSDTTGQVQIASSGNATFSGDATFSGSVAINSSLLSITNDAGIAGIGIRAKSDNICYLDFGDSADSNIGGINYSNANDKLNLRTGNSNKVTIDSSGKVGIGTDNPGQKLHVSGGKIEVDVTSSVGTELILKNLGVNQFSADKNYHEINFITSNTSSETTGGYVRIKGGQEVSGNDNKSYLGFWTAPNSGTVSEKMRITSAGNVGVGTNNPLAINGGSTTRLHTKAGILVSEATEVARFEGGLDGDGASAIVRINTSNDRGLYLEGGRTGVVGFGAIGTTDASGAKTESIRIANNGNVGIGTTSPNGLLHVYKSSASPTILARFENPTGEALVEIKSINDNLGVLQFADNADGNVGAIQYDHGSNSMRFKTNDAERMRLASNGNLGIGTDSPDVKLEVVVASPTDGIVADFVNSTNAGGTVAAIKLSNADAESCDVILGANRVGANFGSDFFIKLSDNIDGSNIERFRIREDGNVGIGATNPVAKLEILGAGQSPNSQSDVMAIIRNSTYNGTSTSGENKLIFGWNNHYAAAISAYKDGTANRTGFKFYTEVGYNTPVEAMRITSAGNLILGATGGNPYLAFISTGGNGNNERARIFGYADGGTYGGGLEIQTRDSSNVFQNRMRITSAGDVLFGTTGTPNGTSVYGSGFINESDDRSTLFMATSRIAAAALQIFINTNGIVGSISVSGSTTTYNTSSDYRLKEDLQDFNGLEMVSKIPVYDFKWKVDESRSYGVMAHELQEVLPDAVSGEKDAEEMQGVDYSKIVPLLIKSIQELTAKVERLEAK